MFRVNHLAGFGKKRPEAGGGSAPTFVSAGTIVSDTSPISFTPAPGSHQTDDILLVIVTQYSSGGTVLSTATSGWSKIGENSTPGGVRAAYFWKRATSNAEAGPTITSSDGSQAQAVCYAFRGCVASGTPFEDATLAGGQDTNPVTSAIDTLGTNRLAAVMVGIYQQQTLNSYPPSPWTDASNQTNADGTGSRFALMTREVASASNVAQATIGTLTGGSNFDIWETLTLALIPA